jgi:tetratricopeptide (TPR) repeat protein
MNRRFLLALALSGVVARYPARLPAAARSESISDTDQQIERFQEQAKKTPSDYSPYDALGVAFFQKARETGDISYFELAEQTLKKSLELAPHDFRSADPEVHMALVCMGEHRFTDALSLAQQAIAWGSGNLAAFAVEGDAYTDLGHYEQAASAYNAVQTIGGMSASPRAVAYMIDSRKAYLQFLNGDSAQAIQLMQNAITAGLEIRAPSENLAWLYFELGERYFQAGDLRNAEQGYASGIAVDPNHYRSIAGLARVRAAQGRLEESVQLYQRSIAIIPFPVYVAELGDVYEKMGRREQAQREYELVEYIAHLSRLHQVLANRELALFYADRGIKLAEALQFARRELEVRHDIYTWDALAWVLYKEGRLREAADAMKNATHLNTNDSLLLFHAGMIAHSLGADSDSQQLLSRALTTNAHFHVFYADVARRTLDKISRSQEHDLRTHHVHD